MTSNNNAAVESTTKAEYQVGSDEIKLSSSTKLVYGMGDLASQFVWTFTGSYLTIFYTDVVGLTPAIVAMIMLIARIWDGINDPMLGILADRTKTKHGRFRPYILYGAPFLALFSVLAFTAPSFGGNMEAKIAWATFTYIGLGMLYTVVNLPYGSLSSVMTKDSVERNSLNAYRMTFTQLGGVFLSIVSMPLILMFSNGEEGIVTASGYTYTAIFFAVLALPIFYLVFYKCKEVVTPVKTQTVTIKDTLKSVFASKALMCIFFMMLITLTAFFGRIGTVIFYLIYVVHRVDLAAIFMPLPFIGAAVGVMLFARFATKLGKKNTINLSNILAAAALIGLYFVDPSNIVMVMVMSFLYGLALFAMPVAMALIPDAIDEIEDDKGVRIDGAAYASFSLATKFASAIGGSGAVLLLGYFGYVANAEQTAEAINGINIVVNVVPAIFFLLACIPVFLYPLTEEKSRQVRANLAEKKRLENLKNN